MILVVYPSADRAAEVRVERLPEEPRPPPSPIIYVCVYVLYKRYMISYDIMWYYMYSDDSVVMCI